MNINENQKQNQYQVNKSNNNENNEKLFFERINMLPKELYDIVKSYIFPNTYLVISKSFYMSNHIILTEIVRKKKRFETYIRYIIRRDFDLPFGILLNENHKKWLLMTNYEYNHAIYANYLYFLQYFCIKNSSEKCRNKIMELFEETGLSKNQHKKNIVKYIKL